MLGKFARRSVMVGSTEFVLAVDPKIQVVPSSLVPLVRSLAEYEIGLFGGSPFKRYTFFVHSIRESGFNSFTGGSIAIEHLRGTTISFTPQATAAFKGEYLTAVLFELFAHELFHSWNGKGFRPAELVRPDLNQPIQSTNIWFVEGVTRYYDILARERMARDGAAGFYDQIGALIVGGNVEASLEQISAESWKGL